ncbi:MAG: DUF3826 domain-containing protein [Bacteroidetes bacterium]|nr:DUF3826 domain-containing protein [Bacteroidota bacterium]
MKRFLLASNFDLKGLVLCTEKRSSAPVTISFSFFYFSRFLIVLATLIISQFTSFAQDAPGKNPDYMKVLTQRSEKIVSTLGITDSTAYRQVVDIIANQYYNVNELQDQTKEQVKAIKAEQLPKSQTDSLVKLAEEEKSSQLMQLHAAYISLLNSKLTQAQVEKVKDGMTYNILNVTYKAYGEMILTLTETQKNKIYNWLKEARELAMDEGSSEDKHKVFGKYKGRINNYLSQEGYDMKKEEKDWQERIKQKG